jgi:hypothetical protein
LKDRTLLKPACELAHLILRKPITGGTLLRHQSPANFQRRGTLVHAVKMQSWCATGK